MSYSSVFKHSSDICWRLLIALSLQTWTLGNDVLYLYIFNLKNLTYICYAKGGCVKFRWYGGCDGNQKGRGKCRFLCLNFYTEQL